MYSYSFSQWLLFFFIYCFLGWVWESSYVSFKSKKWTNRGFMRGPLLPIYGSGAMIILIATLPLKDKLWLVFISGMFAATVLEYFTGAAMEAMFKVRYWDYSNRFMNLNGHICLKCSILWGFFSILMVKIIHVPIEKAVLLIPEQATQIISFVIAIIVAGDFTNSFKDAINFKNLLMSVTANNEEIERLKKKLDITIAFANADIEQAKKKINERLEEIYESKNAISDRLGNTIEEMEEAKEKVHTKFDEINLQRYLLIKEIENSPGYEKLMRRHPGATSVKFEQAFEQVKKSLNTCHNDKK